MAYCFTEGCSCKGEPEVSVEDQLDELKNWVQDLSNRVDSFVEEETLYGVSDPMWFIRELQEKLEKKKNEVMGYDDD